jgi:ADP-ribosyl-[dinitrogen reductase] hydrolase
MLDDRQRGCFIGLAVGDALGAAIEFRAPGTFKPVTGYRSGGPHGLAPGEWTDDTSMAMALADSITCVGWDLNDQAKRYIAWWRQGEYSVNGACFDIGITTRSALVRFLDCGDARRSGDSAERASGNGSVMRLAPVLIRYLDYFPGRIEELADLAEKSSLTTHASPQCLSACRYMTLALCGLMHGLDRNEVLSPDWKPLSVLRAAEPLQPAVDEVAMGNHLEGIRGAQAAAVTIYLASTGSDKQAIRQHLVDVFGYDLSTPLPSARVHLVRRHHALGSTRIPILSNTNHRPCHPSSALEPSSTHHRPPRSATASPVSSSTAHSQRRP